MGAGIMFINATETIGLILGIASNESTGSLFLSLLIFMIILFAFCLMFGIPIEYSAIIMLPLVLSCMAYYQEFYVIGGVIFIYLAIIITKNWIIK